jgi:tripartite-type tricarboxylate transporter receptor subunit TctC
MNKNKYLYMLIASLAVAGGAGVAAVSQAQNFPVKPMRIVVGFPAGGGTDIATRAVAQKLSENFGQQVIVENRPGAASNIGAEFVARAAPDGYTIFMGSVSLSINATLYAKLNYDAQRDFTGVAHAVSAPFILVTHPSVPVKNVKEFIAFAKARPGQVNFATAGAGSGAHLFMELFSLMADLKMTSVHYKGQAPATVDVLAGQIPAQFDSIMTLYPMAKQGKLRAHAVSTIQRSPLAPEVPTLSEAGVPGYDADAWFALMAPAATPKDIIARLHGEVTKALQTPDLRERLRGIGATPGSGSPEQFNAMLRNEIAKWAKVVKAAGVRVD